MLPQFLQSSYERYKGDTSSFATWLADTARACGHKLQIPTLGASKSKKGKQASTVERKYPTSLGDLRKFGQVIAQSAVEVPEPILAIA